MLVKNNALIKVCMACLFLLGSTTFACFVYLLVSGWGAVSVALKLSVAFAIYGLSHALFLSFKNAKNEPTKELASLSYDVVGLALVSTFSSVALFCYVILFDIVVINRDVVILSIVLLATSQLSLPFLIKNIVSVRPQRKQLLGLIYSVLVTMLNIIFVWYAVSELLPSQNVAPYYFALVSIICLSYSTGVYALILFGLCRHEKVSLTSREASCNSL